MMPALFEGISVSAGVAAGRVVRLGQEVAVEREEISQERVAGEIERLNNGLEQYRREIQAIIAKTSGQMSRDEAAILETHILISQDPELLKAMRTKISTERKSAPWAADEAFCSYSRALAGLPGDYFQERAYDIMEIRRRVLACLGEKETKAAELAPGSVIVAEDL